jgi:hypothetical protein
MRNRLLARLTLLSLLLGGGPWFPTSEYKVSPKPAAVPLKATTRMGEHRFFHSGVKDDCVLFSRDGRHIVSSNGFCVNEWDCATGELVRAFPASTRWFDSFAISSRRRILATVLNEDSSDNNDRGAAVSDLGNNSLPSLQ